jgi:hypothetical protein
VATAVTKIPVVVAGVEFPVSGIKLDGSVRQVPCLIATSEEEGIDLGVLDFLLTQQHLWLVLDDGRAFPALVQYVDGKLECRYEELPPSDVVAEEYVGAWALPS